MQRLWRYPYGLEPNVTPLGERSVEELSAGAMRGWPEVVFLPGLGAPGYLAPWARATSGWTRATVLNLPGWRGGRARSCTPTLDGVAEATVRWLEVTGRSDVLLVGHSTGAQAAARAALLAPELLAGLVLGGPTFDPAARSIPAVIGRALHAVTLEVPGEVPAVLPTLIRSGGIALGRFLLSALRDGLEERVPLLRCPLLVLTGQRDVLAPPHWAQRVPAAAGAECVILPGAHNSCFPYPAETDAAVRAWLSQLRPPGPDVALTH